LNQAETFKAITLTSLGKNRTQLIYAVRFFRIKQVTVEKKGSEK